MVPGEKAIALVVGSAERRAKGAPAFARIGFDNVLGYIKADCAHANAKSFRRSAPPS